MVEETKITVKEGGKPSKLQEFQYWCYDNRDKFFNFFMISMFIVCGGFAWMVTQHAQAMCPMLCEYKNYPNPVLGWRFDPIQGCGCLVANNSLQIQPTPFIKIPIGRIG